MRDTRYTENLKYFKLCNSKTRYNYRYIYMKNYIESKVKKSEAGRI